MMRTNSCPKCQSSMAEGFLLGNNHGMHTVTNWVEGTPIRSIWTGLKLGKRPKLEIQTWRCTRCGFLENYAKA